MNCLLESVAGVYLGCRNRLLGAPVEDECGSAQEHLEDCMKSMGGREKELVESVKRLGREALTKKREGDLSGARAKVTERLRAGRRLDKLRNSMHIVESQLDAMRNSELDKEIMYSLKTSTAALKKAGVSVAIADAETVINELDEQLKDIHDVTAVLANPVGPWASGGDDLGLDEELEWLEQEGAECTTTAAVQKRLPAEPAAEPPQAGRPPPPQQGEPPLPVNAMLPRGSEPVPSAAAAVD